MCYLLRELLSDSVLHALAISVLVALGHPKRDADTFDVTQRQWFERFLS